MSFYNAQPGAHVIAPQGLNAVCGTVQSVDTCSNTACLTDAHDIFGRFGFAVVPLADLRAFAGPPRRLSGEDLCRVGV